jgi:hypothetical protein
MVGSTTKKKNTEETHHLLVATLTPRVLYDCKAIGEKNLFKAEKNIAAEDNLNKLIHY